MLSSTLGSIFASRSTWRSACPVNRHPSWLAELTKNRTLTPKKGKSGFRHIAQDPTPPRFPAQWPLVLPKDSIEYVFPFRFPENQVLLPIGTLLGWFRHIARNPTPPIGVSGSQKIRPSWLVEFKGTGTLTQKRGKKRAPLGNQVGEQGRVLQVSGGNRKGKTPNGILRECKGAIGTCTLWMESMSD